LTIARRADGKIEKRALREHYQSPLVALVVQTAPELSASAAFAGLLFRVVGLFFDATCVAFFLTASSGRAAVIGQ